MPGDLLPMLDTISPSFCPLRWSYLQIDLQHGRTKACCKTPFQPVTERQLAADGSAALFNGAYVKERRAEMLAGFRHDDCATCWRAEGLGLQSYRQWQAAKPMFREVTEQVAHDRTVDGAVPRHIEIIMRTMCDLACAYCGPDFSNRWQREIERQGQYPTDGGVPPTTIGTPPVGFARTFRDWLAEHLDQIRYIQFNGGEPLIQDEFYEFLEIVRDAPVMHRLQLGVITNLNTPPARLRQLLAILPDLHRRHDLRFGISLDAVGRRAEYIRFGLRWKRFDENMRTLLRAHPELDVQLAPTLSALSLTGMVDLIGYVRQLEIDLGVTLTFRPGMVMWPDFQSPLILLPDDYRSVDEAIMLLDRLDRWPNLRDRLSEVREGTARAGDHDRQRAEFHLWFSEYDRRRNLRLVEIFPELSDFWAVCTQAAAVDRDGGPPLALRSTSPVASTAMS